MFFNLGLIVLAVSQATAMITDLPSMATDSTASYDSQWETLMEIAKKDSPTLDDINNAKSLIAQLPELILNTQDK